MADPQPGDIPSGDNIIAGILSQLGDLAHTDPDEVALAKLPLLADRIRYHTKRLRVIQHAYGAEGVAAYKAKHPEARAIQIISNPIAYTAKPSGYDDFLTGMVSSWFNSDAALTETNRAAVIRLSDKLGSRFDPDRHFSVPLSAGRLKKLADVFSKHGAHLDTSGPLSMSDVRKAAKAFKAGARAGASPFGNVGTISSDVLTIGLHSYRIERHKDRACIRVTAQGTTQRIYLTTLQALLASVGEDDPLSNPLRSRERELVPGPGSDVETGEFPQAGTSSPGECADCPPSMAERIARLRADRLDPAPQHSTTNRHDPDADPLAL